jgi:hypothetical protein
MLLGNYKVNTRMTCAKRQNQLKYKIYIPRGDMEYSPRVTS